MNDNMIDDEETKESLKNKKIFNSLKHDFDKAKLGKKAISNKIINWNKLYYGETKAKAVKGKSQIVTKEIAKQIEWLKPNITEPFLSTSHPVRVVTSGGKSSKPIEKYLNTEFTASFNRVDFINKFTDVLLREGTTWTRVGWKYEEGAEEVVEILTMEQILLNPDKPSKLEDMGDDKFRVTYINKSRSRNNGTMRVCRNEFCFPDPVANSLEDMRFFAEKQLKTISELRKSGLYKKADLDKLENRLAGDEEGSDLDLEQERNDNATEYGRESYTTKDTNRNKVSIIEYWGYYDLNGDGIAEPMVATWAEKEDILLRLASSPVPSQKIPYYNTVYSEVSFSLWGNPIAYFIEDNQNIKSGLMRGMLDNVTLSNNGQKFIKTGTMDYLNLKRLKEGQRYIEVLKENGIEDGQFNQLPGSFFNVMQLVSAESAEVSGISGGGQALSNDMMAKSDNGGSGMTMAQQRMAATVRNMANTLSKILGEWLSMAEVFIDNDQIEELFSDKEETDFFAFKYSTKARIEIKVATDVQRMAKLQQLNMLMQQSKTLGNSVPPSIYNKLVAEMFELFDMYNEATELSEYEPKPTPEQQQAQQMEMQKAQLEIQKLQVEIQASLSKIELDKAETMKALSEAEAGNKYKEAQVKEKEAKATQTKMETALSPARFLAEVKQFQEQQDERKSI